MTDINQSQTLDFDAMAAKYPKEKFILLMPNTSRNLLHAVQFWSLDVSVVEIDPDNTKHAYPVGGGQFGLGKAIYDKIATAADLSVVPARTDDRTDRMRAEFSATAMMNTPSGGLRGRTKSCEWDGVFEESRVNREASSESGYAKAWSDEQKFGKRKAETKACNRAISAILGMDSSYPLKELKDKSFAVMRFVFSPDLSDPVVKEVVLKHMLDARSMLYPAQVALPPAAEPVAQLAAAPAEAEIVEDGPPEEVRAMIAEIEDILADWPGNEKMKGQTHARLDRARENKDLETIENLLNYCRDLKIASEGN